jgi:hypothetical protein
LFSSDHRSFAPIFSASAPLLSALPFSCSSLPLLSSLLPRASCRLFSFYLIPSGRLLKVLFGDVTTCLSLSLFNSFGGFCQNSKQNSPLQRHNLCGTTQPAKRREKLERREERYRHGGWVTERTTRAAGGTRHEGAKKQRGREEQEKGRAESRGAEAEKMGANERWSLENKGNPPECSGCFCLCLAINVRSDDAP